MGEDGGGASYASCGARASFSDMVRIPVAPEAVERALAASAEE
jgi:hypothetical protein